MINKLANVQSLSKEPVEITLEVKVPKLRYNKVPSKPEELEVPKLNIPDPIDISRIGEEVPMFNEDIPDYRRELVSMGYSETAVEYLEGIPNLEDCRNFVALYEEYISDLKGKEEGLFRLQNFQLNEIVYSLMCEDDKYEEEKLLNLLSNYLDIDIENIKLNKLQLHKDLTITYNGKVSSNMLDKVLLETNGRNFGKMGIALKGQF